VAIIGKGDNVGKFSTWHDLALGDTLPYICKSKASTDHPNPPPKKMCEDSGILLKNSNILPHSISFKVNESQTAYLEHSDFASFNNECYYVSTTPKTWHDAQQDCLNRKSNLVSILDRPTQFYLVNEIQSSEAWIGLSNIQVGSKIFKFVSNKIVCFTFRTMTTIHGLMGIDSNLYTGLTAPQSLQRKTLA
jgi:hypothetical protein